MNDSFKPIIKLIDVSKAFIISLGKFKGRHTLQAVCNVSMSLFTNEVVGLVGESGCGKSTLGRIILGLSRPSEGQVFVEGRPMSKENRFAISSMIQPIFQDPYSSLNPRKSVGSILSLPLRVHPFTDCAKIRPKVEEMLDLVGLPRHSYRSYPNQLSGGQRQRVAIARALIIHPNVVVCDEPTSALDVSMQSQILNLLIDLRKQFGLTYLFISHNLAVVEHLATRVAVMYYGRIVEEAKTEKLFEHPQHPYTKALLASVLTPDPGLGLPDNCLIPNFASSMEIPAGCAFEPRCPYSMAVCRNKIPKLQKGKYGRVACFMCN